MSSYLHYIYQQKCGNVADLETRFGNVAVRQMEAMGYIINAPKDTGDTWRISNRARKLAELRYRKSTISERFHDWINLNVRKIDFSI